MLTQAQHSQFKYGWALVLKTGSHLQMVWLTIFDYFSQKFNNKKNKAKKIEHKLISDRKTCLKMNELAWKGGMTGSAGWLNQTVPDVTDLSGTSRAHLPPPARGTAFEFLLAVMFVCKPSTHLQGKNIRHFINACQQNQASKILSVRFHSCWSVDLT